MLDAVDNTVVTGIISVAGFALVVVLAILAVRARKDSKRYDLVNGQLLDEAVDKEGYVSAPYVPAYDVSWDAPLRIKAITEPAILPMIDTSLIVKTEQPVATKKKAVAKKTVTKKKTTRKKKVA